MPGFDFNGQFFSPINNKFPKPRVLSSQAFIKLSDNRTGIGDLDIGEIDHFSSRKSFETFKRWKPFGYKTEKMLTDDKGWELNFNAGKVSWKLAYLISANERAMIGDNSHNRPTASNTYGSESSNGGIGTLYNKPKFSIYHTIKHYSGKEETFVYVDVEILNYEQEVSGDNGDIKETVQAFSPKRYISDDIESFAEFHSVRNTIYNILNIQNQNNRGVL